MQITATFPREISKKAQIAISKENEKSILPGVLDLLQIRYVMPSQRAADKETLSFYVPRTLGRRLRKLAKMLKVTLTDVVVMVLSRETNHIELTPEDYEEIARATRAAQRQGPEGSQTKTQAAGKSGA